MIELPILISTDAYIKNLLYGVNSFTGEVLPEDAIVSYNYIPGLFLKIADIISRTFENIDRINEGK